jgi:glycosyltransferase involved in cell wall biosynthesis
MQRICRSLANSGYDVLLVGRKLRGSAWLTEQPYRQKRLSCIFNKGMLFYAEYNIRLFFFLLFSRVDILSAVDLDTIMPSFFAAKIRSKKMVFDAHEYFPEVPEVHDRPFVKSVWKWIERSFIPPVRSRYTVSQSIANVYDKKFQASFELVRNLPLLDESMGAVKKEVPYLLYQGALNEGRALEELLEAAPSIPCDIRLAGGGDLEEKLKAIVKQKGLQNKVQFLGYVEPQYLKQITAEATIGYNLLRHVGISYYYSLSNKFFDYMHAGIPSLNPAFPEYLKVLEHYQTGICCEPIPALIAEKVKLLLEDKSLYEKLSRECILARRTYCWQQEEKKLLKIYEQA